MADEKPSGGGGSGWGPFEVILAILLGVALVSRLQGEDYKPLATDPVVKPQTIKQSNSKDKSCGLATYRPAPLETVRGSVTLEGRSSGCNWKAQSDVALYAQVVDARDNPVSAYTTVYTSTPDNTGDVSFSTTIRLTATPDTNTGYVLLLPANNLSLGEKQITVRLPIQFEQ